MPFKDFDTDENTLEGDTTTDIGSEGRRELGLLAAARMWADRPREDSPFA